MTITKKKKCYYGLGVAEIQSCVVSPSEAVGRPIFHTPLLLLWTLPINLKSNSLDLSLESQITG